MASSQFIRYQIRFFCFLINKYGTQIKTKYNVFLLKPLLDSDETKVTYDETSLPVQSKNNHMIPKKLILYVWRISRYLLKRGLTIKPSNLTYPMNSLKWHRLSEVLVKSSKNSTLQTCLCFSGISKRKKDAFLPHIYKKFLDSIFDSLPRFYDKFKVSIQKIMKSFGPYSEVATSLLKLFMIRNRDPHGSPLTLANTHGI